MNEFLRNFIMKTIAEMIEKNIAEWQVRQYALSWYSKSLLTEEDLASIEQKYAEKEVVENTETTEEVQTTENVEVAEETVEREAE